MSDLLLCLAIGALVLLDGGFAGYRARAGRYARIRRLQHDLRAVRRGVLVAAGAVALAALIAIVLAAVRPGSGELLDSEARTAASRILWVAGCYSMLVIAAFGPFLSGSPDARSLTTVVLFGPLTLIRPLMIIGACVAAAWGHRAAIVLAVAAGGALVLAQDVVLDRLGRRGPRL